MQLFGPAIAALEFSSIAKGYYLMDLAVKKAPVKILEGSFMSPGKFFLLINGDEASVTASYEHLMELTDSKCIDSCLIPNLHENVLPGFYGTKVQNVTDSVAIIETLTLSSGFKALDLSLKGSQTELIDFKNSRGIGGKSFYILTGHLEDIQASVEISKNYLSPRGMLINCEIVARPDDEFLTYFNISGEL